MIRPTKFKIVKINNALIDYECQRLLDLYKNEKVEFLNDFNGFDIEYINLRVEDIVHELTGIDIIYQEPIYIGKSADVGIKEPTRADAWEDSNPIIKQYGNRVFTFMVFLTDGEIYFPQINLKHKGKVGDGLIWNNVINSGRVLDSINQISNDVYYMKRWVREKPFI